MKNIINRTFFGRNATISFLFVLGIFFVVGFACGGSGTPPPSQYVGSWTGSDGTTMTIRSDGSADYKSGSSSVSGGGVTIDEAAKTLKITFASLGPTFKIDKAPDGNQMTLDGVVFKKGGSSDSKSDLKSDISTPEIPNNDRLQTLVKTTFMDFSDAVQAGDFTDFHKTVAKVWQEDSSADEMKTAFKSFVDNKESYNFKKAVASLDATFSPSPAIEKVSDLNALVLKGYYPTKGQRANFDLKYTKEDGNWKLIGVNIKTTNQ